MAFHTERILDTIALCEGYDGLGLGISLLEPAYRNICGVEREAFAVANMVKKNQETFMVQKPQWSDVSTFRIPRLRGLVDCITAGIPCQPFSCAGKQRGVDDVRWIWPSIYRIIDEIRPRILFFEEVSGFKKHGLPILLRDIAKIGYDATWDCFRAPDVEAPHKKRERIFILARLANPDDQRRGTRRAESAGQWRDSNVEQSSPTLEELDNSERSASDSGTERSGWASRTDPDGTGAGAGLAITDGQHNDDAGFGASEIRGERSQSSEIFRSMANPNDEGLQGHRRLVECPGELPAGAAGYECGIWPARGGELQYKWEPPRLVDSPVKRRDGTRHSWGRWFRLENSSKWAVESSLGGDPYGITSRVDELRLCGNGVIPLMAALAWYVLKKALVEAGGW